MIGIIERAPGVYEGGPCDGPPEAMLDGHLSQAPGGPQSGLPEAELDEYLSLLPGNITRAVPVPG